MIPEALMHDNQHHLQTEGRRGEDCDRLPTVVVLLEVWLSRGAGLGSLISLTWLAGSAIRNEAG